MLYNFGCAREKNIRTMGQQTAAKITTRLLRDFIYLLDKQKYMTLKIKNIF